MKDTDVERLKEIIRIAKKLNWIYPIDQPNKRGFSYPLMQLSEVEKCMLAMTDDYEFKRLKQWEKDVDSENTRKTLRDTMHFQKVV